MTLYIIVSLYIQFGMYTCVHHCTYSLACLHVYMSVHTVMYTWI